MPGPQICMVFTGTDHSIQGFIRETAPKISTRTYLRGLRTGDFIRNYFDSQTAQQMHGKAERCGASLAMYQQPVLPTRSLPAYLALPLGSVPLLTGCVGNK